MFNKSYIQVMAHGHYSVCIQLRMSHKKVGIGGVAIGIAAHTMVWLATMLNVKAMKNNLRHTFGKKQCHQQHVSTRQQLAVSRGDNKVRINGIQGSVSPTTLVW